MGDETKEVLRNGTADYDSSAVARTSPHTLDKTQESLAPHRTAVSSVAPGKMPLSPLSRSVDRHNAKTSPKRSAPPTHRISSEHGSRADGGKGRYGELDQQSLHSMYVTEMVATHRELEGSSTRKFRVSDTPGSPTKRRCMDTSTSLLPELDLEIDGSLDIYLDEVPHDHQSDQKELLSKVRDPRSAGVGVDVLAVDEEHIGDIRVLRHQVRDLQGLLVSKDEDLRLLKLEMKEREEQHSTEIQKLREELHREYSKQASEKLRVIVKRLESSAKRRAERDAQERVLELSRIVEKERREKAELVQACDEYLRLKGF